MWSNPSDIAEKQYNSAAYEKQHMAQMAAEARLADGYGMVGGLGKIQNRTPEIPAALDSLEKAIAHHREILSVLGGKLISVVRHEATGSALREDGAPAASTGIGARLMSMESHMRELSSIVSEMSQLIEL